MSVDPERGILVVPLTSPATDYYGGDRKGANLFGDSVLALDAATGKRLWHFQTIHHDLWDWDLPAQPNLVAVRRDGRDVPAVAQVTKTGFLFLLDRLTGKPLIEVEERAVPQSVVPGERTWPTQPFPVRPPPFARQTMTLDELTDVTPESRAECLKLIEGAVTGPMFRPIGFDFTVMFPGTNGGANWGGASYDAASGLLFVNSMDVASMFRTVERPPGSKLPYRVSSRSGGNSRFWDSKLNPCQKPPWGHLTAIDLNKGEHQWMTPIGDGPRDHPLLKGLNLPPLGERMQMVTVLVTRTLLFVGATPVGTDDRARVSTTPPVIYAFDKSGKPLRAIDIDAFSAAAPMTYMHGGKQYIVVATGRGPNSELVALSLPN